MEVLMRRFYPYVYRILSRFSRKEADVEELMQDIWVKVFDNIKKLKEIEKFKSWLGRIAYHTGITYLRKASKEKALSDIPEPSVDVWDQVFSRDLYRLIWQELKTLKEKYQMPVILLFFEKMSYQEIALVMDTKLNTVKSLIKRGKELLKERLKAKGVEEWNI
ncbi:MAG: hypothetical protein CVV50_01355 [Spirochaetae bacterium HGW-Spirochaetae-6]|nr:MAG: hypothetical protein CVV50_01355 [Spirochaetae bacterium HGW-Spirochaetae-6]